MASLGDIFDPRVREILRQSVIPPQQPPIPNIPFDESTMGQWMLAAPPPPEGYRDVRDSAASSGADPGAVYEMIEQLRQQEDGPAAQSSQPQRPRQDVTKRTDPANRAKPSMAELLAYAQSQSPIGAARQVGSRDGQPVTRYTTPQGYAEFQGTPTPGGSFSGAATDAEAMQNIMERYGITDPSQLERDAYGNIRDPGLAIQERALAERKQKDIDDEIMGTLMGLMDVDPKLAAGLFKLLGDQRVAEGEVTNERMSQEQAAQQQAFNNWIAERGATRADADLTRKIQNDINEGTFGFKELMDVATDSFDATFAGDDPAAFQQHISNVARSLNLVANPETGEVFGFSLIKQLADQDFGGNMDEARTHLIENRGFLG